MPIYNVQAPDGKIYKVEGPENAKEADLFGFVQQQIDTQNIRRLQREYGPGVIETFGRGVRRGAGELASTVTDVIPAMAASALGFDEYAKQQLEEAAKKRQERTVAAPPVFESYRDVEGIGDALKFAAETVGEQVPNIATALIPGAGAGALATRLGVGAFGRSAAVGAGTFLGSYAQNAPEVFQNIYRETGQLAPGAAAIFGAGSAALDSILPAALARQLSGPVKMGIVEKVLEKSGMDRGLLRSVTANALRGVPIEGLTEGAQEAISIAAEKFVGDNPQIFESKEWDRIMESAVRGAVAGGVFGGVGGVAEAAQNAAQRRADYADALERRGQRQLAAEVRRQSAAIDELAAQQPQMQLPGFELGPATELYTPPKPEKLGKEPKGGQVQREMFTAEGELTPAVAKQAARDEKKAAVAEANRARQEAQRQAAELKEAQAKLKKFLSAKQLELPGFDEASIKAYQEQVAAQRAAAQASGQGDLFESPPAVQPTPTPTPAPQAPPALSLENITKIDDLKSFGKLFGIGPTARILKSDGPLAGKDISNPQDAAEVRRVLEAYASGKPATGAAEKIESFLKRPEFQGAPDATGTIKQPSGTSTEVAGEPSVGAAPGDSEQLKPSGVVSSAPAATDVIGREEQQPAALTERQQRIEFGKALGAVQPYPGMLQGRKNLPAQKAAVKGDFPGVLDALEKSKNATVAEVARRAKNLDTKIQIDEAAGETYEARNVLIDQMSIDGAKMHLAALSKLRELASEVNKLPDRALLPFEIYYAPIPAIQKGQELDTPLRLSRIAENNNSMFSPLGLPGKPKLDTKEDFNALLNAFERTTKEIGEDKLRLTSTASVIQQGVAGAYNPETNTIHVPEYNAKNEAVLAHEIVHAQVLQAVANPTEEQKPAVQRLNTLYQHVKKVVDERARVNDYFRVPYGVTNVQEFISEGLANPDFQYLLSRIQYQNTTVWDKFVEAIAKLLGLKNDNALTELLTVYSDLTNRPAPTSPAKPPQTIPSTKTKTAPGAVKVSDSGAYIPSATKGEAPLASAAFRTITEDDDIALDNKGLVGTTLITGMDVQQRNKGLGSKLLNSIINWADSNGKTLVLVPAAAPDATLGGLNQEQLKNWYAKNGFESRDDYMVRSPQLPSTTGVPAPAASSTETKAPPKPGKRAKKDIAKAEAGAAESVKEQAKFINEVDQNVNDLLVSRLREKGRDAGIKDKYLPSEDYRGSEIHNFLRLPMLIAQYRDSESMLSQSLGTPQEAKNRQQMAQIEEAINASSPDATEMFNRLRGLPIAQQTAVLSELNRMGLRQFDEQVNETIRRIKETTPQAQQDERVVRLAKPTGLSEQELDVLADDFNTKFFSQTGKRLFLPSYVGPTFNQADAALARAGDFNGLLRSVLDQIKDPAIKQVLRKLRSLNLKVKLVVGNPEGPMALPATDREKIFELTRTRPEPQQGDVIQFNIPWVPGGHKVDAVVGESVYMDKDGREVPENTPGAQRYVYLSYKVDGQQITNYFSPEELRLNTLGYIQAPKLYQGKAGSYDPATNTITLDPTNGMNAHTFIHEAIHAAISNVLASPNHPLSKDFQKFFIQIQDRLGAAYGAQNLQEFAAELVGNPSFQAVLKSIKTPRSENMFRHILRKVAEFFGFVPKSSAFDTGLNFIDKALDLTGDVEATAAQKMFLGMGNFPAIAQIGQAMPAMTKQTLEGAKNIYSNLSEGGGFKRMAFGLLRLDNLRDMYGDKLPSIQTLLDALEKRTGMQERKIKDANTKYKQMVKVQKENAPAMKRLNDIAIDARIAGVDILDPKFQPSTAQQAEYSRLKNQFASLPKDVQDVYRTIRKDYDASFFQYMNILEQAAKSVSPSLATRLAQEFQTRKPLVGYVPFLRQGNFFVEYEDPQTKERAVTSFQSFRERQQFVDSMLKNRKHRLFQNIEDMRFAGDSLPPTHFIYEIINGLKRQGASDAQVDGVYQAYLATFPAESLMKQFMKSKNTAGMERDIVRGYGDLMIRYARKLSNSEYIPQIDRAVRNIQEEAQKDGDPTLVAAAQNITDQSSFFHNPTYSAFVHTSTALSYFEFIAGNISSALINITSLPMMVWPKLVGSHGWANATAAMTAAGRTAMNDWSKGKYKNLYETLMDHAQLEHTMAREVLEGRRQSTNEFVGLKGRILDGLSIPMSAAEKYNRAVTAIAAYDLAKQSGMSEDRAIQQALNTVKDVHTSGMAVTGPKWMQTPLGRMFFTFKSFIWNSAYVMARAFHQAFKGEDPKIRAAAQRQLLATYGMATVLTGMKGMPFYGAASVLASMINTLFGDEEEPFDFDEFMRDVFGETLFKGFANKVLNLEIANRAGIATDLIFRDDPRGIAEHGYVLSALQQSFGPLGSIAVNSERAIKLFGEGEVVRGLETIMPSFYRNASKGMRYLVEGATTIKGDPIMEDIGAYNSLMQMMGFSPADLSSLYEKTQAAKGFEREIMQRRQNLLARYNMARTAGDFELLSDTMDRIAQFNAARPAKAITQDTLRRSQRARDAAEKEMIAGVRFDKDLRPEIINRFYEDED